MDVAFEQQVRERAYQIWQAAGMEDGFADLHWLSAEQAVIHEVKTSSAKPATAKAARSVTAKVVRKATATPRAKSVGAKAGRSQSSSPSHA